MSLSQHWILRVFGRVLTNAIVGGVIIAIIGALCVATAGAFFGWMMDIRSTPPAWNMGFMGPGAFLGAFLGAWSGFVGALAGAVAALGDNSTRPLATLRALLNRVALGQLLATLGAVSSYLLLALAIAQIKGDPFIGTVEDNLELAIYGAPITMICGAIAGALWKRADGATR